MSRGKKKNEIELLESEIRELKSENRKLKRKLRESEKYPKTKKIKEKKTEPELCSDCGKGEVDYHDFGVGVYRICKLCKHREKVK